MLNHVSGVSGASPTERTPKQRMRPNSVLRRDRMAPATLLQRPDTAPHDSVPIRQRKDRLWHDDIWKTPPGVSQPQHLLKDVGILLNLSPRHATGSCAGPLCLKVLESARNCRVFKVVIPKSDPTK